MLKDADRDHAHPGSTTKPPLGIRCAEKHDYRYEIYDVTRQYYSIIKSGTDETEQLNKIIAEIGMIDGVAGTDTVIVPRTVCREVLAESILLDTGIAPVSCLFLPLTRVVKNQFFLSIQFYGVVRLPASVAHVGHVRHGASPANKQSLANYLVTSP